MGYWMGLEDRVTGRERNRTTYSEGLRTTKAIEELPNNTREEMWMKEVMTRILQFSK